MFWCYSEAYNTGTQKWSSIVQYSCTSIWDLKYTFSQKKKKKKTIKNNKNNNNNNNKKTEQKKKKKPKNKKKTKQKQKQKQKQKNKKQKTKQNKKQNKTKQKKNKNKTKQNKTKTEKKNTFSTILTAWSFHFTVHEIGSSPIFPFIILIKMPICVHPSSWMSELTGVFMMGDMGPLPVLVSPCFRENVVVTCKIGSFLCSLDNLLQKNVILFFFEKQISKWRSLKKGYFWPTFHIFSHQRKVSKIPYSYISQSYTYMFFAYPIDFFLPYQFKKKYEFIR